MKYPSVYDFNVFKRLEDGVQVYAIDKKEKTVVLLNEITVKELITLMALNEQESGRFEFFEEVEE